MHSRAKKAACIAAAAVLFFSQISLPFATASADTSDAVNITKKCTFTVSSNKGTFKKAVDGNLKTNWKSAAKGSQYVDITIPAGESAGALYFHWGPDLPKAWVLYAVQGGVYTDILEGGADGYQTDYETIPAESAACTTFRLQAAQANTALCITEIAVYTPGNAPYYAPHWQSLKGNADILLIATHPDDEQLYLGPVAPNYIQQGKKVVTAFVSYESARRRLEAQEAVWSAGERNYPALTRLIASPKTFTIQKAEKYWPLDGVVNYIVEQIRRFKPSVLVTQDINGEYGHGAHKLVCYATQIAFLEAGDPQYYPASAAKYGVWNPAKLYIHLYPQDTLTLGVNTPLSAYGGQTALQVIQKAYARHMSQLPGRALPVDGPYDFTKFGLFDSRVGPDTLHNSMLENISDETMKALNPPYTQPQANRSALLAAFVEAQSRVEADYTPRSWQAADLPGVIADALDVYHDSAAPQARVDAQTGALNKAIRQLVHRADTAALNAELRKAKARLKKYYTAKSWAAAGLPAAITAAQAVLNDPNATQAQANEQTALLKAALGKLVRK